MNYNAMNLGLSDLSLGIEFFNKVRSATFPLITSNLVYKDSQLPFGEKYIIKKVRDIRVGIVGVMPLEPIYQKAPPDNGGCSNKHNSADDKHTQEKEEVLFMDQLEIIPPEDALKSLLPQLRSQADLVILLSQCGFEATTLLVNKVDGIDLAISAPNRTKHSYESKVPIMETAHIGKRLGFVKLTLDDSGQIINTEKSMVRLNNRIPFEERIVKITGDDIGKKIREDELRKMEKEAKALLELSPEKYYEMLMKEQTKTGGKK